MLMQGDEKHVRIPPEDMLRAVSVVHVPIHDGDSLKPMFFLQVPDQDGGGGEQAETHRLKGQGVVARRSGGAKGVIHFTGHDGIRRTQGRIHGGQGGLIASGAGLRVPAIQNAPAAGARLAHEAVVRFLMHPQHPFTRVVGRDFHVSERWDLRENSLGRQAPGALHVLHMPPVVVHERFGRPEIRCSAQWSLTLGSRTEYIRSTMRFKDTNIRAVMVTEACTRGKSLA